MVFYLPLTTQCIMSGNLHLMGMAVLFLIVLAAGAGCSAPEQNPTVTQTTPATVATSLPATVQPTVSPVPTTIPSSVMTTIPGPANTTLATTVPTPTPTAISEAALNARIVDARNKLEMFIDSDVSDTVIMHYGAPQNCDVKKSKELGYLIDMNTGESTFVKGDYWSIDADLFSNPMRKDHEYIVIHTHPRMWVTCGDSSITSLYTFSIGDLEATANLTEQGYHVRRLIAIADKEYRIWPSVDDNWKSGYEVGAAVRRIETQVGKPFSYYDPVFNQTFYDVDNLMPLLVKELDYHYTVNNIILN